MNSIDDRENAESPFRGSMPSSGRERCVIVGGSGFLGKNLACRLARSGRDVVIADRNKPDTGLFKTELKGIPFVHIELPSKEGLEHLLRAGDIVFHLAYSSVPGTSLDQINDDIGVNVIGSVNLFEAAVKKHVKLVVFPSSGGTVYGEKDMRPIIEDCSTDPICSYGVTKLTIEKYLKIFNKIYGLDYFILRIANLYGPGQRPFFQQGLIAAVIGNLLKGEVIKVFGNGLNIRDYIHVDDVIGAMELALGYDVKNVVYNIGSGTGLSVNEVIERIAKIMGKTAVLEHFPDRNIDVKYNVLDSTRIRMCLDWSPKVDIDTGIGRSVDWIAGYLGSYEKP